MAKYILRRIAFLPLVILGVTCFLFFLTQRLPVEARASLYIQDPRQMDSMEEVIKKYNLDKPFFVQYGNWIKNILSGDFGYSESANMPVAKAIKDYFEEYFDSNLDIENYNRKQHFIVVTNGLDAKTINAIFTRPCF